MNKDYWSTAPSLTYRVPWWHIILFHHSTWPSDNTVWLVDEPTGTQSFLNPFSPFLNNFIPPSFTYCTSQWDVVLLHHPTWSLDATLLTSLHECLLPFNPSPPLFVPSLIVFPNKYLLPFLFYMTSGYGVFDQSFPFNWPLFPPPRQFTSSRSFDLSDDMPWNPTWPSDAIDSEWAPKTECVLTTKCDNEWMVRGQEKGNVIDKFYCIVPKKWNGE